ncbi:MAG: ornithine cyclodeaminase [Clostridiaceae bacterium]|nr:ornithine cyclodeaminase [Clostridiaceae bacterium]
MSIEEEKQKMLESGKLRFLYLDEEDMIEAGVLDAKRCVDVMEETIGLLEDGDFLMGGPEHNAHGLMLEFPKKSSIEGFPLDDSRDRRFIAMPAYLGGRFHVAGEKWYGSNGKNRSRGLPRSILMTMLNDVDTGAPLAFMSANLLSSMRTGAMPGLASKLLARKDSRVLALIGPGAINRSCLRAIMTNAVNIDTIKIKGSSPVSATALSMKKYVEEKYPQLKKVEICETLEEAIRDSDIVSEAVSCKFGDWPVYKKEWFKPGALIISASVFNMDKEELKDIRKIVDNYKMYEDYAIEDEMGYDENGYRKPTGCMGEEFVYMVEDGLIERESIDTLGEIIRGKKTGRKSEEEVILVAIEGMPIEDVAWGYECYTKALENGIGQKLKVWNHPAMAD